MLKIKSQISMTIKSGEQIPINSIPEGHVNNTPGKSKQKYFYCKKLQIPGQADQPLSYSLNNVKVTL